MAACLTALSASTAGAQSVFDSELRLAPQFMQYHLRAPANETISELALPLFVSVPVGPRVTFDVGTAYARARVASANGISEITGLTDTQVRGNLTLGNDFVVLTAGLNLPTGQRAATLEQYAVATRIGSDFLGFPIPNMGAGFAGTGGVAIARPLGEWNVGFGAAVRRSAAYVPFNIPNQSFRYQPGNEYRVRVGTDGGVGSGAGRVAFGVTYSAFGQDDIEGIAFRSGNRLIAQSAYTNTLGSNDLTLSAYDVIRTGGRYASGDPVGRENLVNVLASIAVRGMGTVVEPSIELRHWQQRVPETSMTPDRTQGSFLSTLGVRARFDYAGVTAYPGVGYSFGTLAATEPNGMPTHAGLTGFRVQLAMRAAPFAEQ
jgi:hypothetical protein